MAKRTRFALLLNVVLVAAFASGKAAAEAPCSDARYRAIDAQVPSGDGQGHGPDIGSDEWKSVIEFRLGVRGQAGVPDRGSEAWCRYVDGLVAGKSAASASEPSFDCGKAAPDSVETAICGDEALSALDRKLAGVYAAASAKATNEHPPTLKTDQRGWIKGRDECWKADDRRACVESEYIRRIAELQARYRLVPHRGPVFYACEGNPANEVVATYFETEPPTLVAERGDSTSLMYLVPAASGAKYQGRNESLWEHQGEARVTWGYGAPEMRCRKR